MGKHTSLTYQPRRLGAPEAYAKAADRRRILSGTPQEQLLETAPPLIGNRALK